ncbi:crotonase/enoyl-CoA hydratase family protein [Actinomadura nitritigenes]|uniref:Enoyl-CoA hydratase/isomerase family protein n=1 Tax=Actinomadura nitritigenes TaxID=134602 RepID=A0ABS3QX41_9ACTN|nr:enoyl-CoA hydratase-related protein [Actinomadura nitritigenes]MBO2438551.1 enoyl-CoA hydratase/isomerase family protein [Actinomadura nitritigenes]
MIRTARHGDVHLITLDRPDRRNAVDGPMAEALAEAVGAAERDDEVRAIVLTGAGGAFCAGNDLKAMAAGDFPVPTPDGPPPMRVTRTPPAKPVVAAVEGYCFGGGFELALWADLRVASATAEFGTLNLAHGLPCLDGATVRLPRLVGQGRALDILLTARRVPADQALAYGLVDRLVDAGQALEGALELAGAVARLPVEARNAARRSVLEQWALPEDEAAGNEARLALGA